MSGNGRKNAAAKTKPVRPRGPDASSRHTGDEGAGAESPSGPLPSVEHTPEVQERVLRQLLNAGGRFYHGMTAWLEHDRWHIRVLGVLTWLIVLCVFAGAFLVMTLKWEPWVALVAIGGFTGITALGNLVKSRRGPN